LYYYHDRECTEYVNENVKKEVSIERKVEDGFEEKQVEKKVIVRYETNKVEKIEKIKIMRKKFNSNKYWRSLKRRYKKCGIIQIIVGTLINFSLVISFIVFYSISFNLLNEWLVYIVA
jgi:hypothetical protein